MSSSDSFAQRYSGSMTALLSNLGFPLMDTTAQSCTRDAMSPGQVAFRRMAITLTILSVYIIIHRPSSLIQLDPRSRPSLHGDMEAEIGLVNGITDNKSTLIQRNPALAARLIWLRSALISLSLCFLYASLSRISLSEFGSIASTRSFVVGILCWLVLRERFGWRLQVASVVSTLAVLFIIRPPAWLFGPDGISGDTASRSIGFLFCLANLVENAVEITITRIIGPGPDPVIMTLAYGITCVFVAPVYMLIAGETFILFSSLMIILKLSAVAVTGLIAQIGFVMALQRESGGTVSVIAYSQIPFSVIIQSFILEDVPNIVQGVAMVIIAVSGIWVLVAESNERMVPSQKNLSEYLDLPADEEEMIIP